MDPRMVQAGGAVVIWDGAEVDHLVLEDQGGVGCHVGPLEEQCVVEAHGEDWDGATVLEVHHLVGVD